MFPEFHSRTDSWILSALYCAPIVLFYNSYWAPPLPVKYGSFIVCAVLAFGIAQWRKPAIWPPVSFVAWTFASLLMCALYWRDPNHDQSTLVLFLFSIVIAWCGFLLLPRIEPRVFIATLTVALSLVLIQIWANFGLFEDIYLREFNAGTLTFDSYPVFGSIAAISGLLYLSIPSANPLALLLKGAGMALVAFVLFNGQSRGELLAFIAVASMMLFPRGIVLVLPLALVALYLGVQYSDLPIFERFRLGVEAGFADRFQLFGESFDLLTGGALLTGLGINGFQNHYGLDLGFYPHNSALEAAVSGGVGYFLLYLATFVSPIFVGALRLLRGEDGHVRALWAVPSFLLLISLKSFSIFTNWMMLYLLPLSFLYLHHSQQSDRDSRAKNSKSTELA